jgi:hypothetical protein
MASSGSNLNYPAAPAAASGFVSDFDEASARLARKRRLAQMLQQQALQGMQLQSPNAPASWLNALAPMAQALAGQYSDTSTDKEEKELQKQNQANLEKWVEQFPKDQPGVHATEGLGPTGVVPEPGSPEAGSPERKMLPEDFIKWGLGGMQFGKAGQAIGEDVIKSYLPKKGTGSEDWKYETVYDKDSGKERKAWVNKSNPGAPPVFVGGESSSTELTKNVDFYKSKGYSEEDAIKMASKAEHVVAVPAGGELKSVTTMAPKPGAAPTPTPPPVAPTPPAAPPLAPVPPTPVVPPAAPPVAPPPAVTAQPLAQPSSAAVVPGGVATPANFTGISGGSQKVSDIKKMEILNMEYQAELAKGPQANPANIKALEGEMGMLEKRGVPRQTAPAPAAVPAPLDASNAPATPATGAPGMGGTQALVSQPPMAPSSQGAIKVTRGGPYDTTPQNVDSRVKTLTTGNNAVGQERLIKDAVHMKEGLRATGLPAYEQAIRQAEKRLAEVPVGQLKGFGKVANTLPDAVVGEEARDNRLAIAPLLRIESLNAGGKAFTPIELEEIKKITGTGFGRSEQNLRQAVKQLREKMDAIKKNEFAGVHPDVLNYLGQNDPFFAGTHRPSLESFER